MALGALFGVGPGALIAHYGFGVTWGKSILIGIGVMVGLGMIERATYTAPTASPQLPAAA